jgi:hypothetical protein
MNLCHVTKQPLIKTSNAARAFDVIQKLNQKGKHESVAQLHEQLSVAILSAASVLDAIAAV